MNENQKNAGGSKHDATSKEKIRVVDLALSHLYLG